MIAPLHEEGVITAAVIGSAQDGGLFTAAVNTSRTGIGPVPTGAPFEGHLRRLAILGKNFPTRRTASSVTPAPPGGTPRRMTETLDVVVIGGGVMGCASAWLLAEAGLRVRVLERSVPGAEASSAAAGILGAQIEAHGPGPMTELSLASRARWSAFADNLRDATGIDVEYREHGVVQLAYDNGDLEKLRARADWQRSMGLEVDELDGPALRALEPALAGAVAGGLRFAQDARIDPPRLLKALHFAALRAGAAFSTGAYVARIEEQNGRATGVLLEDGSLLRAKHIVVAAGSWSTLIGGLPLAPGTVRPARGQIVELTVREPLVHSVVFAPGCYLVPRDDGRLLVGSTLELVGYRREVTAKAVRDLLDAALRLVPSLEGAALGKSWSNFRPYTETGKPLLGETTISGLVLATGHFRNGILLAPITAEIVRAVVLGERPPVDLSPFAS